MMFWHCFTRTDFDLKVCESLAPVWGQPESLLSWFILKLLPGFQWSRSLRLSPQAELNTFRSVVGLFLCLRCGCKMNQKSWVNRRQTKEKTHKCLPDFRVSVFSVVVVGFRICIQFAIWRKMSFPEILRTHVIPSF